MVEDGKDAFEEAERVRSRIKEMRQAGLESAGEFSVENLVFKYLRNNGHLDRLSRLRRIAYDDELSVSQCETEPAEGHLGIGESAMQDTISIHEDGLGETDLVPGSEPYKSNGKDIIKARNTLERLDDEYRAGKNPNVPLDFEDVSEGSIVIGDGDTIGSSTTPGAISIASNGDVNFTAGLLAGSSEVAEYGSNANGEYVRFYNGMQICWHEVSLSGEPVTITSGGIYIGTARTWTFPAQFDATPSLSGEVVRGSTQDWGGQVAFDVGASATSAAWRIMLHRSVGGWGGIAGFIAIGTWS